MLQSVAGIKTTAVMEDRGCNGRGEKLFIRNAFIVLAVSTRKVAAVEGCLTTVEEGEEVKAAVCVFIVK